MTAEPPLNRSQPATEPAVEPLAETSLKRRIPGWRLWLPLLFQSALIVTIPAQNAYTFVTGRTVVLQTAPVDPYDFLRGYSQTLGYEISQVGELRKLPGGDRLKSKESGDLYVVLEAPASSTNPPKPWKPVRISVDRPTNLPANQIALKGYISGLRLSYGLETYYMPEDQRQEINQRINNLRQEPQAFLVEIKVDSSGNAVPVSLWVRDRNYRF